MAIGQIKLSELLSRLEEEFSSLSFFPLTIAIYSVCRFKKQPERNLYARERKCFSVKYLL